MLYKLVPGEDVFKNNPELKAVKEFLCLNSKEMEFVVWYADPKSPLRRHADKERRRLAALKSGYVVQDTHDITLQPTGRALMNGTNEKVEKAIIEYKTQQPDDDRNMLMTYTIQIENIMTMVRSKPEDAGELKKVNDLLFGLPELRKSQIELAKLSGLEDELEEIEVEARKETSTLAKVINEEINAKKES